MLCSGEHYLRHDSTRASKRLYENRNDASRARTIGVRYGKLLYLSSICLICKKYNNTETTADAHKGGVRLWLFGSNVE
jgi:hypothetical protein